MVMWFQSHRKRWPKWRHLTANDIRDMEDRFYKSRCGEVSQESNRDVDLALKAYIYEEAYRNCEAEK